jgi:CO/xanthine dehydrogenase Mo-binding subunit
MRGMPAVGRSAHRYEGAEKLTGRARYLDDVPLPGCLFGATLRSPVARGVLREIVFDPTFPWDEFVVCTAKDVPGRNCVALIDTDQPLLVTSQIRHRHEPIVLVAHPLRARAYEALTRIHLEIDELDPVLTIEDSLSKAQVIHGDDNILKSILIEKGDVEAALRGGRTTR